MIQVALLPLLACSSTSAARESRRRPRRWALSDSRPAGLRRRAPSNTRVAPLTSVWTCPFGQRAGPVHSACTSRPGIPKLLAQVKRISVRACSVFAVAQPWTLSRRSDVVHCTT